MLDNNDNLKVAKQEANVSADMSDEKKTTTTLNSAVAGGKDKNAFTRTAKKRSFQRGHRKICMFCAKGILHVDYKDVPLLKQYLNVYGKILPRRQVGNCLMHQRFVSNAIKRARIVALLPFIQE